MPTERSHRPNLLIVRAGENSLHPGWLDKARRRNFDLLVSYYGEEPGRYRDTADSYHVMRGPRWPAHAAICRTYPAMLESYDFVGFACDDLIADQATWNALFASCRRFSLDLAQPAIRGHCSHGITRPVDGCVLRYTNFVEIMCPVLSRRALAGLQSTFDESVSGWGLDLLWSKLSADAGWTMAIVDRVQVTHSRPVREGTLAPVLSALGIDPGQEAMAVLRRFNLPRLSPRELGRVVMRPGALTS